MLKSMAPTNEPLTNPTPFSILAIVESISLSLSKMTKTNNKTKKIATRVVNVIVSFLCVAIMSAAVHTVSQLI